MSAGVFSLAPGEPRRVDASSLEPATVEVLSGAVDVEGSGPLGAGEATTFTAAVTITGDDAGATVEIRDPDEEED